MVTIELKQLYKSYQSEQHPVLVNLNLVIHSGQFVAVIGEQGSGKSTLLRVIAGIEPISHGELWFDQRLMNTVPANERDVGLVLQSNVLYPKMTVAENMAFGLTLNKKHSPAAIKYVITETAEMLALSSLLQHRTNQLTEAQRQRVVLARAIARKPAILLLDEPLSSISSPLKQQLQMALQQHQQQLGITILYSTTRIDEANTLTSQQITLTQGEITHSSL